MKTVALAAMFLAAALPVFGQTAEPDPPSTAPSTPPPAEEQPKPPKTRRWFFGGGLGAAFGSVDYVYVAPLLGVQVAPRVDIGIQPFYQWTNDDRYAQSFSTTDYGAGVFTRVRIDWGLFAEADYQFTSYEYVTTAFTTIRDNHNAFLLGGGYSFPVASNVGLYVSALYDFTWDEDEPYGQYYDSPLRFQIGVSVGF